MSELLRRVIVAVIGAPIALGAIWFGDATLATLAGGMAAIAAWEYFRIAKASGGAPLSGIGVICSALVPLLVHAEYLGVLHVSWALPMLVVLTIVAACLWLRGVDGRPILAAATTVFGVVYTGGTLGFAYALRYYGYAIGDTPGALVLTLPVVLTWASDVGAYTAGRAIGGVKLMPSVSPGKTVAGAVGGMGLTIAMCAIFVHYFLRPWAQLSFSPWGLIVFGLGISLAAQTGDLVESMFKREAGVKDSGTIFPGHGGMLDRLDSLFFVLPVAYALYSWLLIPAPS